MNIIVIGSESDRLEVVSALRKISNNGSVEIIDVSDIENEDDLELVQFDPLTEAQIPKVFDYVKPKQINQWRGGSIGKGGKTKWPRR